MREPFIASAIPHLNEPDRESTIVRHPVHVVFTCSEKGEKESREMFDLTGLRVFDQEGNEAAPASDAEGNTVFGTYDLKPGEYTYSLEMEGYKPLEKVPFTIRQQQEPKTVEILLEKDEAAEAGKEERLVRVVFTCSEKGIAEDTEDSAEVNAGEGMEIIRKEFDLSGLIVLDQKENRAVPASDAEGNPIYGTFDLTPGEYTYSLELEGYDSLKEVPFTVELQQEPKTIEITLTKTVEAEQPVHVEFTCPEEMDLAGLYVYDMNDREIAPASDGEGKPIFGTYELMPGNYFYSFKANTGYWDVVKKAFAVERGQTRMTEEILPERIVTESVRVASEEAVGSSWPGMWGGALIGLLVGAALAAVAMRMLQKFVRKKAVRGGRLRIQARAVQGVGARKDQQDALFMSDGRLYDRQGILMCVADGMGGLSDGAKMSQAVVTAVERGFAVEEKDDPERLIFSLTKQALEAANQAISPNFGSSGSTMVLSYLRDGELTFASVGDSRISLYRDGALWHLNRRHVFEDEMKVSALNGSLTYETATMDKKKGALTSYLGMGRLKYTDLPDARIPLRRGDRIILMSDGVFNTLSDEELAEILGGKIGTITAELAEQIKDRANRYQDNFTAIVVAVE